MQIRKDAIWIVLALMLVTFFLRVDSFKRKHPLSYDESVYPKLAVQIMDNPANYNTMGLYQHELEKGRKLPAYFTKPLFKHPPLFTYLVAAGLEMFGRTYYSAFKVSLFFGVLLIGLGYLLGSTLFDDKVGLYTAFLMAIEPISWITSQKIWMETTLAFFSILSICLFALALRKYNPYVMIASGIAAGFAALVKYPGILPIGGIVICAALFERELFRKRSFYVALAVPFIMLIPWIQWNLKVYGFGEFLSVFGKDGNVVRFFGNLWKFQWAIWLAVLAVLLLVAARRPILDLYNKTVRPRGKVLSLVLAAALLGSVGYLFRGYIFNALNYAYIPPTGWMTGMFNKEPWGFYPWKILELSPLYLFSYIALLTMVFDEKKKEYAFLFVFVTVLTAFWMAWGAYQCRYIVALTVPLLALSAKAQLYVLDKAGGIGSRNLRMIAQGAWLVVFAYLVVKTLRVDLMMAVPNTACYF
jgi:4-amino-4-deoxy-L-arabinose transferase-like glycosyltransferase